MSDNESYEYEYNDDSDEEMADANNNNNSQKDEEEYEYSDDGDQSDFVYTDEDEETSEVDADVENAYYNAKGLKDSVISSLDNFGDDDDGDDNAMSCTTTTNSNNDAIKKAVNAFEEVIRMETSEQQQQQQDGDNDDNIEYGPWSFKAMKQLVKLYLRVGSTHNVQMMEAYKKLLACISSTKNTITQNSIEKGINSILERIVVSSTSSSHNSDNSQQLIVCKDFYDTTLKTFNPNGSGSYPNERLWFKTNLKLGQLLYEINSTNELQHVIRDLLRATNNNDSNKNDEQRYVGTHLMEIYALQIQLYSRIKDTKKLRTVFEKAMNVEGSIPHPRTLALIQELGGKMHMESREFRQAGKTFFQAFKSYDEAGDPSRLRCLKYLVMASMLHAEGINPFDSQEARPYKDDPEIVAMTNLVQAFQGNEIRKFEGILRRNEGNIMDDDFVRENLADLLRTIRTQVLISLIAPYTRISLEYIANELNNIPIEDVESLLISLILDGKLDGKIDQVQGILEKNVSNISSTTTTTATDVVGTSSSTEDGLCTRNCAAVGQLSNSLENLNFAISNVGRRSAYHQIL